MKSSSFSVEEEFIVYNHFSFRTQTAIHKEHISKNKLSCSVSYIMTGCAVALQFRGILHNRTWPFFAIFTGKNESCFNFENEGGSEWEKEWKRGSVYKYFFYWSIFVSIFVLQAKTAWFPSFPYATTALNKFVHAPQSALGGIILLAWELTVKGFWVGDHCFQERWGWRSYPMLSLSISRSLFKEEHNGR